jgi:hypothetical protein
MSLPLSCFSREKFLVTSYIYIYIYITSEMKTVLNNFIEFFMHNGLV